MKGGSLFFLFAGLLTVYLLWIWFVLPETRGVSLEDMHLVFANKKRWKRIEIPAKNAMDVESTVIHNQDEDIDQRIVPGKA